MNAYCLARAIVAAQNGAFPNTTSFVVISTLTC